MATKDKMLMGAGKLTAALQVTDSCIANVMKDKARVENAAMIAEMAEDKRLIEAAAKEEHVRLGANPPLRQFTWL